MSRTFKTRVVICSVALLVLVSLGIAGAYRYIVSGGMIARQKPPATVDFERERPSSSERA